MTRKSLRRLIPAPQRIAAAAALYEPGPLLQAQATDEDEDHDADATGPLLLPGAAVLAPRPLAAPC